MVDFDLKTDPNMDLILTQSRQQLANGQIPQEVNQIGIDVKKSLTSPMMLIALYSPKGTHDAKFLSNYGYINVKDPIARSYGVGQVQIYGIGEYAMRIWVKPDQLAKLGITVNEIANAVQSQNTVNPAGQVGGEPAAEARSSPTPYVPRAGLRRRKSSATSLSAKTRRRCGAGEGRRHGSNWARRTIAGSRDSTVSLPQLSESTSYPVPMQWKRQRAFGS